MKKKKSILAGGIFVSAFLLVTLMTGRPSTSAAAGVSQEEALAIATEAYIYGYPLVTMELTKQRMTWFAPLGQFINVRTYPEPENKTVVAPNADTLYSSAWLDLSKEPYALSLPDEGHHYYLMTLYSAWTDVFAPLGTRTTGNKAQTYVITGPNWKGILPKGLKEIKAPTNMVWVLGRTYCTGTPEDYQAVHQIQDHYRLVPLSLFGKPDRPSSVEIPSGFFKTLAKRRPPLRDQVNNLNPATFFRTMVALMKDHLPAPGDAPMIAKMVKIGIVPGQDFDLKKLEPAVAMAVQEAPKEALKKIMAQQAKGSGTPLGGGWWADGRKGVYGTDYLQRARVAAFSLAAKLPEDSANARAMTDAGGQPLDGSHRYMMHIAKGQTPPAKGFWSFTMYDPAGFFVPNPIHRYSLSSRFNFNYNKDGSLDLYIQKDSPGQDKEANWLPAPAGKFVIALRMYWPKKEVQGATWSWKPAPVVRLP